MSVSIKFTDTTGLVTENYFPKPARQVMPEWFIKVPAHLDNADSWDGESLTAKRCAPLLDGFSSGYILFTVVDILVQHDESGRLTYRWPNEPGLEFQQKWQVGEHKGITEEYAAIPKMPSPWAIETPAGYSCLFVPPLNRDDAVFEIFSGVIDTDTYNTNGSMPFKMIDPKFDGIIPAGTPMAQVIPFKRDQFEMSIGGDDERLKSERVFNNLRSVFVNGYRKMMWTPKSYK